MRDFIDVGLIDIGAVELFFEVVDAQRHDREPIDRRARRFGVEFRLSSRMDLLSLQVGSDPIVDLFDPVVASLVVLIDVPFDVGNLGIGDIDRPCDVFLVPEQVIELVLLADDCKDLLGGWVAGVCESFLRIAIGMIDWLGVPASYGRGME